jgi:putative membrane protein
MSGMKTLIIKWIVLTGTVFLVSRYYSGIEVTGIEAAAITALALGLLNALVKPILWILTLPITLLTLGLFSFVLNGVMLLLADKFVAGFSVAGFLSAIIGSILISIVSTIGNKLLMGPDGKVG